ncbi:FitA-like ribbon-helix-helix domain-containing protein [Pseudonocardia adelaidensis]|uniref:Antitoxin VapB1 n=1 Tax=Pseudonocardia adelaidensis TaxID=648754 RepID=A0ABP9NWT6_9PSEU
MATIQIRDIPDDVYESIRQEAKAAGQSLQAYMREQVTELARRRARWSEIVAEWEAELERFGPTVSREQVLADLDEDRRR